jgi:hypothetical protein
MICFAIKEFVIRKEAVDQESFLCCFVSLVTLENLYIELITVSVIGLIHIAAIGKIALLIALFKAKAIVFTKKIFIETAEC